jgi:hypothetical protein
MAIRRASVEVLFACQRTPMQSPSIGTVSEVSTALLADAVAMDFVLAGINRRCGRPQWMVGRTDVQLANYASSSSTAVKLIQTR